MFAHLKTRLSNATQPRKAKKKQKQQQHAPLVLLHVRTYWHNVKKRNIAADCGHRSTGIPTVAELTARTIEEGGDSRAITPHLIPRIHERLADEHKTDGGGVGRLIGPGRGRGGRGGGFPRVAGRGRGGVDWCVTGGSGKRERAEWKLCEPRTAHCTQRGSRESGFSCGYRNIQIMCSALMERPEYRRWGARYGLRSRNCGCWFAVAVSSRAQ